MINLEPITVEGLDCLVNSYLTLLQYNLGEYQYAFWDTWAFDYQPNMDSKIGEKIYLSMKTYLDNIDRFYSSEREELNVSQWDDFCEQAQKALKDNTPIVVGMDTFYCDWYDNFHRNHTLHTFLLVGQEENEWIVIDTMPRRINIHMPDDRLKNGIHWAKKIKFVQRVEESNLAQFISHTLERKEVNNDSRLLEAFVDDFVPIIIKDEMQFDQYVWKVPILRNIRRIYNSRKQFVLMAQFLQCEGDSNLVQYIEELLNPIISKWAVVMNMFYKIHLSQNPKKKEKIQANFNEIFQLEKTAYEQLVMVQNNPEFLDSYYQPVETQFVQLPIQCNEFSHFFEERDFTRQTELLQGQVWNNDNVSFTFPEVKVGVNHCMKCEGQEFEINQTNVYAIHLIGYATWGSQNGECQLCYETNKTNIEVNLSDWCEGPCFAEDVLWKGKFLSTDELTYDGLIYDVVIKAKPDLNLTSIIMPDCDKMILFAVVLEIGKEKEED